MISSQGRMKNLFQVVLILVILLDTTNSYFFHNSRYQSSNRRFHQSSTVLYATGAPTVLSKVFIGNLPFTVTVADIQKLIEDNVGEGLIKNIQIPVGKKSKSPRGFVFVDMVDEEAAIMTADILNTVTYQDRLLNSNVKDDIVESTTSATGTTSKTTTASIKPVKKASKSTRINEHTVFVTNIDNSLDEVEILNMCEDILGFDLVQSLQILRDKNTGKPRGICYIEFKNLETMKKALAEFNGLEVLGRILVCIEYKPKKVEKEDVNATPSSSLPLSTLNGEEQYLDDLLLP